MTIDPKKLTIGDLAKEISKIEESEELNKILVAEKEGKGRKGAINAITERIENVSGGTGGDGAETFNISTAVTFTAASCGVNVAKHGNRSASGKVGSADVLENLGLPLNVSSEKVVEALKNIGITFLFAPSWHPSLVNLAPLRKSLGVRTVFNLLGPLVNPFRPKAQVLGVAKPELLDPMAEALKNLGLKRAVVVHGAGGLDEASLEGTNQVRFLEDGELKSQILDIEELGLTSFPNSQLSGGSLETNKEILLDLFQGRGTQAQREVVALKTAFVFWSPELATWKKIQRWPPGLAPWVRECWPPVK